MKLTQSLGLLIVSLVVAYAILVGPPRDKHGRYEPRAYIQALMLLTGLLGGVLLTLI